MGAARELPKRSQALSSRRRASSQGLVRVRPECLVPPPSEVPGLRLHAPQAPGGQGWGSRSRGGSGWLNATAQGRTPEENEQADEEGKRQVGS